MVPSLYVQMGGLDPVEGDQGQGSNQLTVKPEREQRSLNIGIQISLLFLILFLLRFHSPVGNSPCSSAHHPEPSVICSSPNPPAPMHSNTHSQNMHSLLIANVPCSPKSITMLKPFVFSTTSSAETHLPIPSSLSQRAAFPVPCTVE